jgi:hypothetical protein
MEFKRSNYKDIERYFLNTWIKFEEFGDTLFYVQSVRESGIKGVTERDEDFVMELHEDQPYVVNYVLPSRAIFQLGNRAAMIRRVPAKQYRRGLCADNTQAIYPDTSGDIDLNKRVLIAYTNKPSYCSFTEAFTSKGDKRITTALSPRMWASRKNGTISFDTTLVAFFHRETNTIEVMNKRFIPEITRHAQAFGDKMEIV